MRVSVSQRLLRSMLVSPGRQVSPLRVHVRKVDCERRSTFRESHGSLRWLAVGKNSVALQDSSPKTA